MIMISILDIEHKKQHSHAQALLKECLGKCGVDYDETMTAQVVGAIIGNAMPIRYT